MALLGIMAPVSMTGMCVFAQSPRDADDLVKIVIPPRFELGILYAPLNLDVLVPVERQVSSAQRLCFQRQRLLKSTRSENSNRV